MKHSFGVLVGLALLGLVGAARGAEAPPPGFTRCAVEGVADAGLCGVVEVPENYDRPDGRKIGLKVVVLPSVGEATQPPLYDLAGGPGQAATASAIFYMTDGKAWRNGRTIVLADMRGTGGSNPLSCPALEAGSPLARMYPPDAVRTCRGALADKADLAQYSTRAAARDLDRIRTALGQDRIDLFAMSYGTQLAQTYIRLHPGRVRSAVLSGAVPLGEKLPLNHAANAERVMKLLIADCEADSDCRTAFPQLAQDWASLVIRLRAGPVVAKDGATGAQTTVEAGPLLEAIRAQMTTTLGQRRLPLLIHRAAKGDFAPLIKAVSGGGSNGIAEGLYLSIGCAEGTLWVTAMDAAGPAGTAFGGYRLAEQQQACLLWGVPRANGADLPLPDGKTAVLFLAGGRDHVTPPDWARRVAADYPNARVIEIEHLSHGLMGLNGMECFDALAMTFLEAASASGLDLSCLAKMTPPPFATAP